MAEESVRVVRNMMGDGWVVIYGDVEVFVGDRSYISLLTRRSLDDRICSAALEAKLQHDRLNLEMMSIKDKEKRLGKIAQDYLDFGD